MKRAAVVALLVLACTAIPVSARTRSGPVYLRGIAVQVDGGQFTLKTHTHGSFTVQLRRQTVVSEKGVRGPLSVANNDHVGVRGIEKGRTLTAIWVHIYPVQPKPFSVKGTVVEVHGNTLTVTYGGHRLLVTVTKSTTSNVGSGIALLSQLHVGDKIELRAQPATRGPTTVIHLHRYLARAPERHVKIRGTVTLVQSGSVSVRDGKNEYHVSVTASTIFYVGNTRSSSSALKNGVDVTVYACCAGHPLRATSIHVRRVVTTVKSVLLRGTVKSLSPGKVEILTGKRVLSVATGPSTTYELGTAPIHPSDVRIGDLVSIRAVPAGGGYRAERIHIYVSSRAVHTLRGTIVSVAAGGLVFKTSAGTRWHVTLANGARVQRSGRTVALASARPGDTVSVRGQERPGNFLIAQQIDITLRVVPIVTVRGRIVSVRNGVFLIVDAAGAHHTVTEARGVRPLLHGMPAPSAALFPGAHLTARGRRTGGTLVATSMTLSVTARSLDGRVDRVWRTGLNMRSHSSTDVRVDFAPGLQAQDGSRRFAAGTVHVGAYVALDGYEEDTGGVWGTSVRLQHPFLDLTGTVVSPGASPTIQTSAGDRYRLVFPHGAQLSVTRYDLTVRAADLPAQAHVHIGGPVASDGTIAVSSATVTLRTEIIAGTVAAVSSQALSVDTAGGPLSCRLVAGTTVTQGSHDSSLTDLVIGDSVTVHGLILAGDVLLVRTVELHRKLISADGTLLFLTSDGFVIDTGTAQQRVISLPTTTYSGSEPEAKPGIHAHAYGYLRGDGAIEAVRIKLGK